MVRSQPHGDLRTRTQAGTKMHGVAQNRQCAEKMPESNRKCNTDVMTIVCNEQTGTLQWTSNGEMKMRAHLPCTCKQAAKPENVTQQVFDDDVK